MSECHERKKGGKSGNWRMMLDIPLWTNNRHAPLVGTSRSEEVAKKTENAAKKFVIKTVQICTKFALEKSKHKHKLENTCLKNQISKLTLLSGPG